MSVRCYRICRKSDPLNLILEILNFGCARSHIRHITIHVCAKKSDGGKKEIFEGKKLTRLHLTKQEQLKGRSLSNKNQKIFSFMILICLHTGLLNFGHQEVQLMSSISHNSFHLRAGVIQSLQ